MAFDIEIENGAGGNGGFFKPKEHQSAELIIFEPKSVRAGVPSQWGPKDFTDGDYTVFLSQAELESKQPSTVLNGAAVEGALGKKLAGALNRVTVGKIGQVPTNKGNPAWIIEQVDPKQIPLVKAYLEEREAQKEKERESLPAFLKG